MMNNIPQLPHDRVWTGEYLNSLTQCVDGIIENPSRTRSRYDQVHRQLDDSEDWLAWRLARPYVGFVDEAHDLENQDRTPETYVNSCVMERCFQWVERFFNQLVLDRREAGEK